MPRLEPPPLKIELAEIDELVRSYSTRGWACTDECQAALLGFQASPALSGTLDASSESALLVAAASAEAYARQLESAAQEARALASGYRTVHALVRLCVPEKEGGQRRGRAD